jgi:hypothetical protein
MESDQETVSRPMPAWLSIPIILLCLGAGGWMIHWYMVTDALAEEPKILGDAPPPPPAQARNRGGWNNLFGSNVRDQGNGRFAYRAAKANVSVDLTRRRANVFYNSYDFAPEMVTVRNTRMLTEGRDKQIITAMKLTEAQLNQLRGLSGTPDIPITAQQRADLIAAFTAYQSAKGDQPREQAQEKIKQLVDEIADKSVAATHAEIISRANKINSIITPEQWKINHDMGGGGN